jgi:hypothetical protein
MDLDLSEQVIGNRFSHWFARYAGKHRDSCRTFKVSPSFSVSATNVPFLLRFGVSYEISQFVPEVSSQMNCGLPLYFTLSYPASPDCSLGIIAPQRELIRGRSEEDFSVL